MGGKRVARLPRKPTTADGLTKAEILAGRRPPPSINDVLSVIHESAVDIEGVFCGLRTLLPPIREVSYGRLDHHQREAVAVDLLVRSLLSVRTSLGALSERLRYSGATIRKGKAVA